MSRGVVGGVGAAAEAGGGGSMVVAAADSGGEVGVVVGVVLVAGALCSQRMAAADRVSGGAELSRGFLGGDATTEAAASLCGGL